MIDKDPRVWLAAERTFLAWIRTGLGLMGFGFVVARFGIFLRELALGHQSDTSQGGGSLIAGVALILLGVAVNTYAAFSHVRARRSFEAGEPLPHRMAFSIVLAGVLALLGVGISVYLLLRAF